MPAGPSCAIASRMKGLGCSHERRLRDRVASHLVERGKKLASSRLVAVCCFTRKPATMTPKGHFHFFWVTFVGIIEPEKHSERCRRRSVQP